MKQAIKLTIYGLIWVSLFNLLICAPWRYEMSLARVGGWSSVKFRWLISVIEINYSLYAVWLICIWIRAYQRKEKLDAWTHYHDNNND